jgi:dUTP pyrophosphatase|tara:strand:+ start:792 stop:1253 length:462 start_codon:yes stop_codon:yes gene_type:complete
MMLEYRRLRGDVIPPTRGNPSDAGLDVFWNPDDASVSAMNIKSGDSVILPTGLQFGIPHGYMLQVMNRSSVAAKRHLVVGAHCVDSGYEGEVFINLHNIGKETQIISRGMKVAQLVMVPVVSFRALETKEDTYSWYPITISDRGDGALGSTGA